jgi:fructose-1,6-bisphosphatase
MGESGVVHAIISDKASKDKVIINPSARYTISFDPLDNGGDNLDCNFAVGTIFGLWDTHDVLSSKVTGREKLVGAAIAGYGTRTTLMIYNPLYKHIEEITLMPDGKWKQTAANIQVKTKAKLFSFATKGIYDNPSLMTLYEQYICSGFSLRYSGCLAMDIN